MRRSEDTAQVDPAGLTARFSQALSEVGGRATTCSRADLAATLVGLLESAGAGGPVLLDAALSDAALSDLSAELATRGVLAETLDARSTGIDLGAAEVGITAALAGIAETGTIVIGPGRAYEGLLASVCPHHIAVLCAELIQPDLDTALAATAPQITPGSRLAFVTGPSRTSDIELTPVVGVHGPLRLDVVIVEESRAIEGDHAAKQARAVDEDHAVESTDPV